MISLKDFDNVFPDGPNGPVKQIRLDENRKVFIIDVIAFLTGESMIDAKQILMPILHQNHDIEVGEVSERAPNGQIYAHYVCRGNIVLLN